MLAGDERPHLGAGVGARTDLDLRQARRDRFDQRICNVANCDNDDQLQLLQEELIDRFGPLPDATRALIDCHRLRILGKPLGIARIDASENAIQLHFVPNPPIEPIKIIKLIQSKKNYKLAGQDRLRIDIKTPDLKTRVTEIRRVFTELG